MTAATSTSSTAPTPACTSSGRPASSPRSPHTEPDGRGRRLPLLLDAAARGHLSYEDVAKVYAEVPARTYGLWPRKGRIAPGADADLVLVDPGARHTMRNETVISKAGWTPYHGRAGTGRVIRTYVRGQLIAEEGKPTGLRLGRFVPGPGART